MKLTSKIVQPFIRALEEALPYQVTITDVNGYIIGSSIPGRIGKFHPSAHEILAGRRPIETLEEEGYVNLPDGVVLGYGEKILYNGECIGLMGLVGPPEERKKDIKTAQFMLRLLLDREQTRLELELAMADRNAFIVRLLHGVDRQELWLEKRAEMYGIDLHSPRYIAVVSVDLHRNADMEPLELSRLKQSISAAARAVFLDSEDLVHETDTGEVVVLTVCGRYRDPVQRQRVLDRAIRQLHDEIGTLCHTPMRIGVSRECQGYHEFSTGYQQALLAMDVGGRTDRGRELYYYDQLRLERIVAGFSDELRSILLTNVIRPLGRQPELLDTLRVYFAANLNVSDTADRLYIHRNTLQYRFKQIKKLTGYDVHRVDDLIQLRLAVLQCGFFGDT